MKTLSSKMAEEKNSDIPSVIISAPEVSSQHRSYKKYAIIIGSAVLTVAIVLTAILVGMYLFNQAQKDIIKFSFNRDDNSKEDVISDQNANTVQNHVSNEAYEAWLFSDFNKDIQAMKVKISTGTNCYVTPLNRTIATDPSQIKAPIGTVPAKPKYNVRYRSGTDAISDLSFLYKAARDACKGISTYWLYPSCEDPTVEERRTKRGFCWQVCIGWFCYTQCN